MSIALLIAFALAVDYLFGEPRRYHPLVAYGQLVDAIEVRFNRPGANRSDGVFAWCLAVLPLALLALLIDQWMQSSEFLYLVWSVGLLYLAIGWKSLIEHAAAVSGPLARGDIDSARLAVSRIVSRDTAALDETGIDFSRSEVAVVKDLFE